MNFVALQRVEPSFILNLSSILTNFAPKYSHKLYSYKGKSMTIVKKLCND